MENVTTEDTPSVDENCAIWLKALVLLVLYLPAKYTVHIVVLYMCLDVPFSAVDSKSTATDALSRRNELILIHNG